MWAVIARRIWFHRNSVIHNGSFIHPNMVYREAILSHEEFKICNLNEDQATQLVRETTLVGHILWQPPHSGVIKINWDAAIAVNKKMGCIDIGIIARDCYDCSLGACSFSQQLVVDPKGAKAIAALNALLFSKEVGFFDRSFSVVHVRREENFAIHTLARDAAIYFW